MRLTIDLDTAQLTAEDRRVLMALAGHDAGELRITMLDEPTRERIRTGTNPGEVPRFDGPDVQKQGIPPSPPLPVPAPADFAARLGEAVQQFGPRGSGPEARLPFAQQAGVRTSSTMPDYDEPAEVVDTDDIVDEPSEVVDVDGPQVIRARGRVSVPRELVEEDTHVPHLEDSVRSAILGVVEQPPVRHTSP